MTSARMTRAARGPSDKECSDKGPSDEGLNQVLVVQAV